jgi:hypothetical protein
VHEFNCQQMSLEYSSPARHCSCDSGDTTLPPVCPSLRGRQMATAHRGGVRESNWKRCQAQGEDLGRQLRAAWLQGNLTVRGFPSPLHACHLSSIKPTGSPGQPWPQRYLPLFIPHYHTTSHRAPVFLQNKTELLSCFKGK